MEKPKVRYNQKDVNQIAELMRQMELNTVCREAACPNIGECFKRKTATFMIMGSKCSRNCRFCNVTGGVPEPLDPGEPAKVAEAVTHLGLKHAVITSVTRDDLPDGGASHFAACVRAVKNASPSTSVEVLIPDFMGESKSLDVVIQAKPDVINHNLETIEPLYGAVRPEADYRRSLEVLQYVKKKAPEILTKTGMMVGLGEKKEQVHQLMDDALSAGCDIFTIGQYLQPTAAHIPRQELISQEMFDHYQQIGSQKGFKYVSSGPLVRSSYHAEEAISSEA